MYAHSLFEDPPAILNAFSLVVLTAIMDRKNSESGRSMGSEQGGLIGHAFAYAGLWFSRNEGMDPYSSPYITHYSRFHFPVPSY